MEPEPPTRRLSPQEPVPPARGTVRETEYVNDAEMERLRDRIRSLSTMLALTALLALAGLGVGLYTLLADDEESENGRRGASPARVSALSDRVDDLEDRVGDRATKNQLDQVEERLAEVEGKAEQAGETGGDTTELAQSIETLDQNVQALEDRVEQLEQAQTGGAGTEP